VRAADILGVLFGWTDMLPTLLPWMPPWLGVTVLLLCIAVESTVLCIAFFLVLVGIRKAMRAWWGEARTNRVVAGIATLLVGLVLLYIAGFYVVGFVQYIWSGGGGGCPPGEYCGPSRYESP